MTTGISMCLRRFLLILLAYILPWVKLANYLIYGRDPRLLTDVLFDTLCVRKLTGSCTTIRASIEEGPAYSRLEF